MTKITILQLIAGALFSLCLATVPAMALNDRTYVSVKGADTGGCFSAAPCRSFAYAITQTAASGQIIVIDPANYGPVTITKSISIVADGGGPAGIYITRGNAITINSGSSDIVNLRGLTLDGAGTASAGISVGILGNGNPGSLTITDCFIRHFKDVGISLTGLSGLTFVIANTVSSDNKGGDGLSMAGLGSIKGVVDHFTASGDNRGISLGSHGGSIDVTIVDSVMAANASHGLILGSAAAQSNAGATLAGSVVTKNGTGIEIPPGSSVGSYGDNEINGNGTDIVAFPGTFTLLTKQ